MSYDLDDTICAVASAAGGAARGIVRVSGPNAVAILARIFRANDSTKLDSIARATAIDGVVEVALTDDRVDSLPCRLYLWPTARSYTQQPSGELHTIGSPPLLEAIVTALCRTGARIAEPGEFTLRAFLAGRIDLTQAEAVLGVIESHGEQDLASALAQLAGGLAQPVHQLRDDLLQLLAELEAGLDFVEEDIEFLSKQEILARLSKASEELAATDEKMKSRGSSGLVAQVVLIGLPNAGKSSLFNAIATRHGQNRSSRFETAIVSPQRGTTRDYLTTLIGFGGNSFELIDTAGIEQNALEEDAEESPRVSLIDQQAQAGAVGRAKQATLLVLCIDANQASREMEPGFFQSTPDIVAFTKIDATEGEMPPSLAAVHSIAYTSSQSGEGIDRLCELIVQHLESTQVSSRGQAIATTADRCRESVRTAQVAIRQASELIRQSAGDELAAAEIRIALAELGKVVGAVYTDDLLDRVFSTFCIGK